MRTVCLVVASLLLTSCDRAAFYDNPFCRSSGEVNQLFCEMGNSAPWYVSTARFRYFHMCESFGPDNGRFGLRAFLEAAENEGFVLAGGTCDFSETLEDIYVFGVKENSDLGQLPVMIFHLADLSGPIEASGLQLEEIGMRITFKPL